MTEFWIIEVVENPAENRDSLINDVQDFLDNRGVIAIVKAVFRSDEGLKKQEEMRTGTFVWKWDMKEK